MYLKLLPRILHDESQLDIKRSRVDLPTGALKQMGKSVSTCL